MLDTTWILIAFMALSGLCFLCMTWLTSVTILRLISRQQDSSVHPRRFPILERRTRPGCTLESQDIVPSSSEISDSGQYHIFIDHDSGVIIKVPMQ